VTIGYFYRELGGQPTGMLEAMLRSVRRSMPSVKIARLESPEQPMALAILDSRSRVSGEWLFLDTDVLVRKDVRQVFDGAFEIAVADRVGTFEAGDAFMARMPYNSGVAFSRSQAFWQACVARCWSYKPGRQAWMGDQQAMNEVIATQVFSLAVVPSAYNYPPQSPDEDVSDKAILHLKGRRKKWLQSLRRAA
jgi:hypothetical protein